MLERKTGEALWRQISERIVADISAKGLAPGSRLPTEAELAAQFEVSRNTLRRAMSVLEDEGIVRIEQGRGTFVHEGLVNYKISKRTRYSENLRSQGREPGRVITRLEEVPASDVVAQQLAITPGEMVTVIESLSLADGVVIVCGQIYYPLSRFPDLILAHHDISASEVLKTYGIENYTRLNTFITTRPPTDVEARILRQPRSHWVLCTQKVDVDEDGKPISFSQSVWAGNLVQLEIDSSDPKPMHD
ncbi:phosphonate metabolism transcriptional regulator PhnF [Rhizobium sp.]